MCKVYTKYILSEIIIILTFSQKKLLPFILFHQNKHLIKRLDQFLEVFDLSVKF
jgi:hypothetical protein